MDFRAEHYSRVFVTFLNRSISDYRLGGGTGTEASGKGQTGGDHDEDQSDKSTMERIGSSEHTEAKVH